MLVSAPTHSHSVAILLHAHAPPFLPLPPYTFMLVAAGKFFWFLLFMTETLLYFTYYGVMCVALTPNLLMAAVASNSLYLTVNLFSGFVIPAPVSPLPLPSPSVALLSCCICS